ncbi:MAG: phosphatase PAP2 family protein [Deltaproteobacteria bacterium]|nr:phosphatase PAP2 family protein [Deltaproteobacteria bacterium]
MKLNAADNLSLLFIAGLAGLVLACHTALGVTAGLLLAVQASLAAAVFAAGWWATRSPLGEMAHAFSPVLLIPVLFNSLGAIIDCINPQRWDDAFARLDGRLFGDLAGTWQQALGRPWWLTDLAYVVYVSYYVLPVVLGAVLYRRCRRPAFDELVFGALSCFYLSYVGYLLFPTLGPRVAIDAEPAVLGGSVVSEGVRLFLHFAERTTTDAFPSGHTAVSLVCWYMAWQLLPRWRGLVTLWVAGIIFTTVYLHYHYVVDVVAGAGLGAVTPLCARGLRRLCEPRLVRRWVAQRWPY